MGRKEQYIEINGIEKWKEWNKSKANTLENQIKKHGLEEGTKRFKEANLLRGFTLENQIKKHGLEEGTKRFNVWLSKNKLKGTKQSYIDKYGIENGTALYFQKNLKLSVGVETLKRAGKSESEINETKSRHSRKSAVTLENQIKKHGLEEGTKRFNVWLSSARRRSVWCKEYWQTRGYSTLEAKNIISEVQAVSSLPRFILRYGEVEGTRRYTETNIKKCIKFKPTGTISKLETMFFNELSKITHIDMDKGRTCRINIKDKIYFCDYYDSRTKKVIEINGVFWHMKPTIYTAYDIHPVTKMTASEKWECDLKRSDNLKSIGCEILVIWEDDIGNDLLEQLEKAKQFLTKDI